MITDTDILRVLSDPRFERTVLAILRRRLANHREEEEPHVSESDKPLPAEWGWVPIADAAKKYGLLPADIDEAIRKKHVRGNGTKVDEDTVRIWRDVSKRAAPPVADDAPQENVVALDPAHSIAEAAALLQLTEERVMEHMIAGTLKDNGTAQPTRTSVHKHRAYLLDLGLVKDTPAPAPAAPDAIMTTAQAAEYLGLPMPYTSALASKGVLVKAGWGRVTRNSVEAYRLKRGAPRVQVARVPKEPRVSALRYDPAPDYTGETMSVSEAAAYLGNDMKTVSALASPSQRYLQKVSRGVVTRASVESMKARMDARKGTQELAPA